MTKRKMGRMKNIWNSYTLLSETVKQCNHFSGWNCTTVQTNWKTIWQFLIVKYTLTIWPRNQTPRYLPMRNENIYLHKNLYIPELRRQSWQFKKKVDWSCKAAYWRWKIFIKTAPVIWFQMRTDRHICVREPRRERATENNRGTITRTQRARNISCSQQQSGKTYWQARHPPRSQEGIAKWALDQRLFWTHVKKLISEFHTGQNFFQVTTPKIRAQN